MKDQTQLDLPMQVTENRHRYVVLAPSKLAILRNDHVGYALALHVDLTDTSFKDFQEILEANTVLDTRESMLAQGFTVVVPEPTETIEPYRKPDLNPKVKVAYRAKPEKPREFLQL